MFKNKLIIFDMDGVLLNSEKNMNLSWDKTMREYKKYKIHFNLYKKHIGLPFEKILKNLKININDFKKIKLEYKKNSIIYRKKARLFPHVNRIIKEINKNYYTAVFTSKDRQRTDYFINKFNLKFDYIVTADDIKKGKPNPEGLIKIKKKFAIDIKSIFFIGDTRFDQQCAKRAKINYLHANWGFEKFKSNYMPKSKILNNFKEIKEIIS